LREPLKTSAALRLFMLDTNMQKSKGERRFVIEELIDDNESAYLYKAEVNGISGRLMEIFPDDDEIILTRDRYGYVRPNKASEADFEEMCREFAESVLVFQNADIFDSKCGFFKNRIYRAFQKNGNPRGTVFMFSPDCSNLGLFDDAVNAITGSNEHIWLKLAAILLLYIGAAKQTASLHKAHFNLIEGINDDDFLVDEHGFVALNPETINISPIGETTPAWDDVRDLALKLLGHLAVLSDKTFDPEEILNDADKISDYLPAEQFRFNRIYRSHKLNNKFYELIKNSLNEDATIDKFLDGLVQIRNVLAGEDYKKADATTEISLEVFANNIPAERKENPTDSVRDLLFSEPFYKYSKDGLRILLIGDNPAIFEFKAQADIFLPLLNSDVQIFEYTPDDIKFTPRGAFANKRNTEKILKKKPNYIFIDYGSDELNYVIAKCFIRQLDLENENVLVAFAAEEENEYEKGRAVFVNKTGFVYTDDDICAKLVRLTAYKNADRSALYKKYKNIKPDSSYYRAIMNLSKTAYILNYESEEKLFERIGKGEISSLVSALHNSYIAELELNGKKSEYAVPCQNVGNLVGIPAPRWIRTPDEFTDELDSVSIELAGKYYSEHLAAKQSDLFVTAEGTVTAIRDTVRAGSIFAILEKTDMRLTRAFNEYVSCLDRVLQLSATACQSIQYHKTTFLNLMNNIEGITSDQKKFVKSNLAKIEKAVEPAVSYLTLESPKTDYVNLIRNASYVYNGYLDDEHLLIPLYVGDNDKMLTNIASVLVIKPKRVTYVSLSQSESCFDNAIDTLKFIGKVIKNHGLKTDIHIEQCCVFDSIKRLAEFKLAAKSMNATHNIISADNLFEGIEKIATYCKNHKFSLIERNHSELSNMLIGAGMYNSLPSFEFDSEQRHFLSAKGCGYLHGKDTDIHLSLHDIFDIIDDENEESMEAMADRDRLFELYSDKTIAWKKLGDILDSYHQKKDNVLQVSPKDGKNMNYKPRTYILDSATAECIRPVFNKLLEGDYIDDTSYMRIRSDGSCTFCLDTKYQQVGDFFVRALTAEKNIFATPQKISCELDETNGIFRLFYNSQTVENTQVASSDWYFVDMLLRELEKDMFIRGYKSSGEGNHNISFTYATPAIKSMLICSGRVLELHTYSSMRESGEFDEVLTNVRVQWPDSNIQNEFDCIAVKGFTTVFVECKAQNRIDQNFYYKLGALVNKFGINPYGFIVADTNTDYFDDNNRMQIDRGLHLNIRTIADKNEIENVGRTIASLI